VSRSINPGGLGAFALFPAELEADELEADEVSRFSVLVAFSAGGFEPQPRMTARQNNNAISLKRIKGCSP
jgi:hypothetical protein